MSSFSIRLLTIISALTLSLAIPAQALAYTVTSNADGSGAGTLRYAIDTSTDDTIDFDSSGNGTAYDTSNGTFTIARNLTINGNGVGTTTLDGGGNDRIFQVQSGITFNLSNVTVTGGNADGNGGAINNSGTTNLSKTKVEDNEASGDGGGVYSTGTLNIDQSTVTGNSAGGEGGGVWAGNGDVSITRSTVDHNTAPECGGGVYVGLVSTHMATLTNDTIASNTSNTCGGGVAMTKTDNVQFTNVTIANNTVDFSCQSIGCFFAFLFDTVGGGGVAIENCGIECQTGNNAKFVNSIVANNTFIDTETSDSDTPTITTTSSDCSQLMVSQGDNIDTDGSCFDGATDQTGDPNLGALQNNGGPTQTMAITNTSIAYNNDPCEVATDQRGVSRPQFGACDIGAFELGTLLAELEVGNPNVVDLTTPGGSPAGSGGVRLDASRTIANENQLPATGQAGVVLIVTFLTAAGLYYGRKFASR